MSEIDSGGMGRSTGPLSRLDRARPGKAFPLGAYCHAGGMQVSVYSKYATRLEVLLFDSPQALEPCLVIPLDPNVHRTYHYWHVFVPDCPPGQVYAFRAYGPNSPETGIRFDGDKCLIDPYSRAVLVPPTYDRKLARLPGDNVRTALRSVLVDPHGYDWEGDEPIHRPFADTVIYEMHLAGFTKHPSSGVEKEKRGTYAGLIEKIPHLQNLGISAVELLPVFAFDRADAPEGRINYWGYSPVSFFAPHAAYSISGHPLDAVNEFRDMVKALHRAGIEVILDVVYNHNAEGDHTGPTFSFKGFANETYFILEEDPTFYRNYSGTGNSLNANNPIVRRMILDSLRYWVEEMHVDGFRFDLASLLSRDASGRPLQNPPVLWDIETEPVLAGTKLIAEAWDAGGLYQVGSFLGDAWKEWNGHFRDDLRRFVRGDPGMIRTLSARMVGSPDVYAHSAREAEQSINFVTCHDGFTLNDLVSYNEKHNLENGEGNRDGTNENYSYNCGIEGPSDEPEIEFNRARLVKNCLTLNLLALGAPMITMGDEMRRTQMGNNNAYCQDSEVSWLDWTQLENHSGIHRFVQELIRARRAIRVGSARHQPSLAEVLLGSRISFHGINLHQPDFSHSSRSLAIHAPDLITGLQVYFVMSSYWEPLEFELPPLEGEATWRRWIDTSRPSPEDIIHPDEAPAVTSPRFKVLARTVAVLLAGDFERPDVTIRDRVDGS